MHYVIPYLPSIIEVMAKFRSIDVQAEFIPTVTVAQKPAVASESKVRCTVDFLTCFETCISFAQFSYRECTMDQTAEMPFYFAD